MSWFKRLFGPKNIAPSVTLILGDKDCEGWKIGDLGECITSLEIPWLRINDGEAHTNGPKKGDKVRVTDLYWCDTLWLRLRGWGDDQWWEASAFRKLDEKGEKAWYSATRRKHAPKGKELLDA